MPGVKTSKPGAKPGGAKGRSKPAAEAPTTAELMILPATGGETVSPDTASAPAYRMQDLMQQIADQSDLKRSDLRKTAGLIFDALGQALQEGRTLTFPGLGKVTPRKRDDKPSGTLLTARIKLPGAQAGTGADGPASRADDAGGEGGENP